MNELTLGDKIYISSKRAAEITGYAKDYVGQLCREGHVEAKMVGRSWYVLESSIRAHRFGASAEEVKENDPSKAPETESPAMDTWEAPRYVVEEPSFVPPIADRPKEAQKTEVDESTAAISDMQIAWKEWFERKQADLPAPEPEPLLESPEVIDARDHDMPREYVREDLSEPVAAAEDAPREDEPVEVPFTRIEEPERAIAEEPEAEAVPIRTIRSTPRLRRPTAAPANPGERVLVRKEKGGKSVITGALLVVLALIFIAIGIVGSGFADRYTTGNPILQFLGGTSTVNNQ